MWMRVWVGPHQRPQTYGGGRVCTRTATLMRGGFGCSCASRESRPFFSADQLWIALFAPSSAVRRFTTRLGLAVELQRIRHASGEIFDARLVRRMRGHEFRWLLAPTCLGHVLPQWHALARIEAGARHQVQPQQIGFTFLRAAVG